MGGSYRYDWEGTTEWNLTYWKDQYTKNSILDQSGGRDTTYALFAQDEIQILKSLKAYIGAREDWWRVSAASPTLSALPATPAFLIQHRQLLQPQGRPGLHPLRGTVFRGSLGQAFRPPTIYDLFRTWRSVSGITYNSNPFLKPETTTSWDIGGEQKLWKGGVFKATYFENYVNDLIYQYNFNPTTVNTVNVGKADIKGVELALEQRFDKWLHLFANYTHNNATVVRDCGLSRGRGLPARPGTPRDVQRRGRLHVQILVGKPHRQVREQEVWPGREQRHDERRLRVDDPYFTADAKLSYQITSFASVSLAVKNIFDKHYFAYYQAPGRQWFGTVTIRF